MVIDYLDVMGAIRFPNKANAPLVIHTDAVLALPISLECLKAIARGNPEILDILGGVQHAQFSSGYWLDIVRDSANRPSFPGGLR